VCDPSNHKEEFMFGMRCNDCGEVRWSIRTMEPGRSTTCPACGAEMVEERRYPGRKARVNRFQVERRLAPSDRAGSEDAVTTA
jgi:uncharacterized OB-fold protein